MGHKLDKNILDFLNKFCDIYNKLSRTHEALEGQIFICRTKRLKQPFR